jgi:hypothetical protein
MSKRGREGSAPPGGGGGGANPNIKLPSAKPLWLQTGGDEK